MTAVHSTLPDPLTRAVDAVLSAAGVEHVAHGDGDPVGAAERAAGDNDAIALIGPFRSRDVADAVAATAPAGLPLLAPVATWAGVTRDDEPGCDDDPADHRGTVLRIVARDTVVARRIAADLVAREQRAFVVAGDHEYGLQLDGQLRLAGLPRSADPADADVVVLAGLAGEPEVERAAALAPLPIVAFDGIQGAALEGDVSVALPFAPDGGELEGAARRAAELVVAAVRTGAADRGALLEAVRTLGPFDEHGDPVDPPVWLWRAGGDWHLVAHRPL
ncbi:MAG TPA: hypothetical protein VH276_10915 [Solirubrobacteraceae bacterium]|nr:hypothetical protein [Solirubrobacteraceae bacterium]